MAACAYREAADCKRTRYAGLPARMGLAPRRNADEDVRVPPSVRRLRGTRASWPAMGLVSRCVMSSAVVGGLCVAVDVVAGEDADDLDVGLAAHDAQRLDAGEAEFGECLQ